MFQVGPRRISFPFSPQIQMILFFVGSIALPFSRLSDSDGFLYYVYSSTLFDIAFACGSDRKHRENAIRQNMRSVIQKTCFPVKMKSAFF